MWIICCGARRSGSTLQYQLTAHLVEMAGKGVRVGWTNHFEEIRQQYPDDTRWKVYKNHNYEAAMGDELRKGSACGVFIYRDLRDVAVSFMQKRSLSFERFWSLGILDEVVENFRLWTQHPQVLVSCYETMMADVPEEVGRIAAHLGLAITPDEAARVATEYSVEKQLERIHSANDLQASALLKGGGFDQHSLLHENHISEEHGKTGQWKTVLTPAQIGMIETQYHAWMKANGYLG